MPLGLQFPDQIVNVQWAGGAVIIVYTRNSAAHRGKIASASEQAVTDAEWTTCDIPYDIYGGLYSNSGASYAKIGEEDTMREIFLLSSKIDNDASEHGCVILFSSNGTEWDRVFEQYEVSDGDSRDPWIIEPTGIVWDKDSQTFYASFYAATYTEQGDEPPIITEGENLYSSTDGQSWRIVGSVRAPLDTVTNETESLIAPYCKKPDNKGKIPDGLQAYNETRRIFMKPVDLIGFNIYDGATYTGGGVATSPRVNPSSSVEITDDDGKRTVSVGFPCYAVAQINGIWIAAGGIAAGGPSSGEKLQIAVSIDDGETWTQAQISDQYTGSAVIAGQKKPPAG
jgi:hypothetical protein